jgi:hypothetical protein
MIYLNLNMTFLWITYYKNNTFDTVIKCDIFTPFLPIYSPVYTNLNQSCPDLILFFPSVPSHFPNLILFPFPNM